LFDLRGEVRVFNAKYRERLFLVVLSVKQMHLLNNFAAFAFLFGEETGQNHAGVVEAAGSGLANPNFALFLLVLPDSGSVVLGLAYKSAVCRV
jgi:hypothetical protein